MQLDELRPVPSEAEREAAQRQLELRQQRQLAMSDTRRALVLDAARSVFAEKGLEGAGIREIARRAGYTPGALYSYFDSKEAIYAALLSESLDRLHAEVAAARAPKGQPHRLLAERANAWFGFYARNPRDLDLGFYLFGGMRPHGLTPELNATLNGRLRDSLSHFEAGLEALGASSKAAREEVTAFFAHCVGLLVLENTKRIKMFEEDPARLCAIYVTRTIDRVRGAGRIK